MDSRSPDFSHEHEVGEEGVGGWGEGKVGVGKRERVVDWQRSLAEELFYGLKKFGFNNRG